jgi:hypothetical protein
MARTTHREVRLAWRDRLRRFDGVSMTVAQFCRAEHVSVTNFYAWRKKLAVDGDAPKDKHAKKEGAFLSVSMPVLQPDVRVLLPGGAVLELGAGLSKERLQQVIAATVTATEQATAESANGQQTRGQRSSKRRLAC